MPRAVSDCPCPTCSSLRVLEFSAAIGSRRRRIAYLLATVLPGIVIGDLRGSLDDEGARHWLVHIIDALNRSTAERIWRDRHRRRGARIARAVLDGDCDAQIPETPEPPESPEGPEAST